MTRGANLFDLCTTGGCQSKLSFGQLETILSSFTTSRQSVRGPDMIDDFGDAAIHRTSEADLCLVTSVDFGTPSSDRAYNWGCIAAQNALSDIYAVGGTPSTALSILGWPSSTAAWLNSELQELLSGASVTVSSASARVVGGHSLVSEVPFFGLSVMGFVRAEEVMRNNAGEVGMVLVLTKPLGSGLAISGRKSRCLSDEAWTQAETLMKVSNAVPARTAQRVGVRAATDVSGFGILGHAHTMARRSGLAVELWPDAIPSIPAVQEVLSAGVVPKSAETLMIEADGFSDLTGLPMETRFLLCDPQTSGGLLLGVSREQLPTLAEKLGEETEVWSVGRFMEGPAGVVSFGAPSP